MDFHRQLGIVKPDDLKVPITVIGVGGIGSPVTIALTKMGCTNVKVYDGDKVEPHNLPNQIYRTKDIGKFKVEALKEIAIEFADIDIEAIPETVEQQKLEGIVICAVDDMDTRIHIWQKLVKFKFQIKLYIEARMGAETFRVFAVKPCDPDDIAKYERELYPSAEAAELPCTERAIIYNVFAIAGMVGAQVKKYVSAEKLPFCITFDLKGMQMFVG